MAQICQDFTMYSRNDLSIRFEGIFNENTGLIIPVGDILGATWAITPYEEQTTPMIQKSLGSGITVPEDGTVIVALSSSDTADLSGEYSHELRLLGTAGVVTAARGKMSIKYQIPNNPV